MDLLLIFACFYFAYSQVAALIDYGSQPWGLVHYLLLLLAIALTAMGIWRSVTYYKEWKYKKAHPEEAEKSAELPSSEESEPSETPSDDSEETVDTADEDDTTGTEAQ